MQLRFSQRKGIKAVDEALQLGPLSRELKNSLWTKIWIYFFRANEFEDSTMEISHIHDFCSDYWVNYLKEPIDMATYDPDDYVSHVRDLYFDGLWHETYDLIEYLARYGEFLEKPFYDELNETLEAERSGYRFINSILTPVTSDTEVAELKDVTSTAFGYEAVSMHIQRALELYSDRENPDYRNSIKESISAVECMAKIATGNPKATLGSALKALAKDGKLHESLNQGFQKLYGYTSEEGGIRHAMINDPNLTAADAKYFLLSCTSFVN